MEKKGDTEKKNGDCMNMTTAEREHWIIQKSSADGKDGDRKKKNKRRNHPMGSLKIKNFRNNWSGMHDRRGEMKRT